MLLGAAIDIRAMHQDTVIADVAALSGLSSSWSEDLSMEYVQRAFARSKDVSEPSANVKCSAFEGPFCGDREPMMNSERCTR